MSAARGFTAIPNHIIRDASIPPSTRLLYGVIMSYAWSARACTASAATLCEDTGIGRSAFFEGIALLRDRGLVEVQKRRSKNGWRNVYVPVAKGVEISDVDDDDDGGGRPTSGRRVVQDSDEGSSATRTQKKTKAEEDPSADASGDERKDAREDPRNSLPADFPDELRPHAREVFRILRAVAEQHGAAKVWPQAVGRAIMAHPNHPLVATAHALNVWAVDPGRKIKNVVQTYSTFLRRERELEGIESLAGGGTPSSRPNLPSGVTPLRRPGGRLSNAEQVEANIQALRGGMQHPASG